MMAVLKGRIVPWGLVAGMAIALWLVYDAQSQRAKLAEALEQQAIDRADTAVATADWQRDKFAAVIQALEERQDALEASAEWIGERREDLDKLEATDGIESEWLDRSLPDGIARWVWQLTDSSSGSAGSVPGDPGVPDQSAARADSAGD